MGELPFEILHISEMLVQLIDEKRISFEHELPEAKITFHDPCRLGRYCGVYDPPRDILNSIPNTELTEMLRHREYAWCCGDGAEMVRSMNPQLAEKIAADRISEAKQTGSKAIVTSCPRCISTLGKASYGIKVDDLTVVVAEAMDLEV